MKIAIHQPHYFPWLGYLDKLSKVDYFIVLDDVQLTDSSYMYRHKLLANNGKTKFITIPFIKTDYKKKRYKDIEVNNIINWQKNHQNFIFENYKTHPNFEPVMEEIDTILNKRYKFLMDITLDTMTIFCKIFSIETKLILQSEMMYDKTLKSNDLLVNLCICLNANYYLSGNGAKKYMDISKFSEHGIDVHYQSFKQTPHYQQNSDLFVPGLSSLDMLFNLGKEKCTDILYNNMIDED